MDAAAVAYREGVLDVFRGYGDAGLGFASGLWFIAWHPIQAAQGVGTAVGTAIRHPVQTGQAIAGATGEKLGTLRGQGSLVGDVLIGVASGGVLRAAAETGTVAKILAKLKKLKGQAVRKAPLRQASSCPVQARTQRETSAINKIGNILTKNFKKGPKGDIAGAVSDMVGNPIPKPGGGVYDHVKDLGNILRGLRNNADALRNSTDASAVAALQRALQAIQQIEEAIQGAGL